MQRLVFRVFYLFPGILLLLFLTIRFPLTWQRIFNITKRVCAAKRLNRIDHNDLQTILLINIYSTTSLLIKLDRQTTSSLLNSSSRHDPFSGFISVQSVLIKFFAFAEYIQAPLTGSPEATKDTEKQRQTEIHLLLVERNKGRNIHSVLSNLICMKEIVKWVLSFSSSIVAKVISRTQEYYLAIEHSMKRRRSDCRGEDEEYNGRNVKAGPVTISLSREEPDQQQINILALQRNLSPPLQLRYL